MAGQDFRRSAHPILPIYRRMLWDEDLRWRSRLVTSLGQFWEGEELLRALGLILSE